MFFGFGPCSGFQSAPAMGLVVAQELCHWHTTGLFTLIWFDKPLSLPLLFQQMYIYSSYISRFSCPAEACRMTILCFLQCCLWWNNHGFIFLQALIFFATFPHKVPLEASWNHHLRGAKGVTATELSLPCSLFRCLFFCQDCPLCRPADPTQTLQCGTWMKFRENHVTSVELMHRSDFQHLSPPLPLHFRKVLSFWVSILWHDSEVKLSRLCGHGEDTWAGPCWIV